MTFFILYNVSLIIENVRSNLYNNVAHCAPKINRNRKYHIKVVKKQGDAFVFFDYHGVVHHEFIPQVQTINNNQTLLYTTYSTSIKSS